MGGDSFSPPFPARRREIIIMKKYFIYNGQKFYHGDRVTCEIGDAKIKDARISVDDRDTSGSGEANKFYICQDIMNGSTANDKLGYKYSWVVDDLSLEEIFYVRNLRKISEVKMENVNYGIKFEETGNPIKFKEAGDPVEFFETKKAAEERITELLDNPDVQKTKIYLFEAF